MKLKKNRIVFEEAEDNYEEYLFEDSKEDYGTEYEEDIQLEADGKYVEEEKNKCRR